MGGLKLLIRAMSDMNYEVHYGILQAGHYGTPPTRVRFCMVMAKYGRPLPQLPQPTHASLVDTGYGFARTFEDALLVNGDPDMLSPPSSKLPLPTKGEPWCDALLAMSEDTFRALNDMGGDTNVEVDAWVVKGEAMLICEEWEDAVRLGPIGPVGAQ
ncbi:uncharacterized protein EDB93DRAFT_1254996 [Suillus bovinus]|uniref:uncharacterized protein n=1 Tax=Suillus bovinus TaxID=48563 RepID=UPI001B86CE63|nr:uncharacterized protein EDB93DRAFT_1254996 [Suillus bovinus]KAG2133222.1 hypothetical protein EDB93DRAFT_1254996 [Suillus bovinus]